jgi:hypothetical protein
MAFLRLRKNLDIKGQRETEKKNKEIINFGSGKKLGLALPASTLPSQQRIPAVHFQRLDIHFGHPWYSIVQKNPNTMVSFFI